MGELFAREIEHQNTSVDLPVVQEFVTQTGQRLAEHLPDLGFPFHFRVMRPRHPGVTHAPTALPGGYVFVPVDLLLACKDEAEFAGMLAHAMAHVVERHQNPIVSVNQFGTVPLVFPISWVDEGDTGLVPLGVHNEMRREELAADRLALRTLAATGYDPDALARYVRRVQPERTPYSLLLSRGDRLQNIEQVRRGLPQAATTPADPAFLAVQQELRRVLPDAHDDSEQRRRVPSLRRPNEQ